MPRIQLMSKDSLIRFIQNHLPVPQETVSAIAGHFEERTIAQHQFFLKEGVLSDEYLFLETGFMRAFTLDTNGNEVTTNFYAANQVVFEVASFFNRSLSKENIEALSDCKGYALNFDQLNALFHNMPEFREFGRAMLVKGFVALKQRTLSLINETAEERYLSLVAHQPGIIQQAPLKYIASYLGVTDTSLSRIRRATAKK
jgi:CRP-like cAMP-binding protein